MYLRFQLKVWIAFAFSLSLTLVIVFWRSYRDFDEEQHQQFAREIRVQAKTIGLAILEIENSAELISENALEYLKSEVKRRGIPSHSELVQLAQKLNVKSFYVTNDRGVFIRSTDTPLEVLAEKTLFDFCSGYETLITGESSVEKTPILTGWPKSAPFKFMMVPDSRRKYILESGIHIESLTPVLKNSLDSSPKLLKISILTPKRVLLDEVTKGSLENSNRNQGSVVAYSNETETESTQIFYEKIFPKIQNCCECLSKGLTLDSDPYHYLLRIEASKESLKEALAAYIGKLFFSGLVGFLSILVLSYFLSQFLVKRFAHLVNEIKKMANDATNGQLSSRQISLPGRDEFNEVADVVNYLASSLNRAEVQLLQRERELAQKVIAQQVAHDIQSPIAALTYCLKNLSSTAPQLQDVLRGAILRIREISNSLLFSKEALGKSDFLSRRPVHLLSLVGEVLNQKKIEYSGSPNVKFDLKVEERFHGRFVGGHWTQFNRVLSNLINNSFEGLENQGGIIRLEVFDREGKICLSLEDTGRGIPAEVLAKLGPSRVSDGKLDLFKERGFGVSHAFQTIEAFGGELYFFSKMGEGTRVEILFSEAIQPDWFVSEWVLGADQGIFGIDDDPMVLNQLEGVAQGLGVKFYGFSNFTSFKNRSRSYPDLKDMIGFIDFDILGEDQTGIEIIKNEGFEKNSFLLTGRFFEPEIQDDCLKLNIKMIPKPFLPWFRIHVNSKN